MNGDVAQQRVHLVPAEPLGKEARAAGRVDHNPDPDAALDALRVGEA
jgi:hypothetical protein